MAGILEVIAAIDRALDSLDPHDADAAAHPGHVVGELRRLGNRVDAERLRYATALDASRQWREDGARSAADWLTAVDPTVGKGAARGELELAQTLADFPQLAEAARDGAFGREHVRALKNAMADDAGLAELVAREQATVARIAGALTPRRFRDELVRMRHREDPDAVAILEERARQESYVALTPRADGRWDLQGVLDRESGAFVSTALRAMTQAEFRADGQLPPEERRSSGRRCADALVKLAKDAMSEGRVPSKAGLTTRMIVLVDYDTLTGVADRAGMQPAELLGCGPLSREAVRRLGAEAEIVRVVFGPKSRPLDVGSSSRLATPAQRIAVTARDVWCRGPGCDRPADDCHVHHLVPWEEGGPTDIANLGAWCGADHQHGHDLELDFVGSANGEVEARTTEGRLVYRTSPPPRPWAAHGDPVTAISVEVSDVA